MARTPRPKPNDGAGDGWPTVTQPDPINEIARRFVVNVRAVMGDASIRSVAARADIDHNTLRKILRGDTWPDLVVIAKLERAYNKNLWPGLVS
jgi:transcriptional regulator with XRE-family HTH domain